MSVEKFLKQRAVNVAVAGNYTLPNWYDPQGKLRTFACRTTRVSPFRMIVDVPVVGKVGDRLSAYFRDFGNFDASISDTQTGSFLLELEMTRAMREKFASKLTWLEKKQKEPGVADMRKDARIIPASPHSTLTLAGRHHSRMLRDRHVVVRRRGLGPAATPAWNAFGRGSLHWSRRQTAARWLRGQIPRIDEPQRSRAAAGYAIGTTGFGRQCHGGAPHRRRPAG